MKIRNKHYISPIDQALAAFDQFHPKSAAQQAEFEKYQRIHALRDDADALSKRHPHSEQIL